MLVLYDEEGVDSPEHRQRDQRVPREAAGLERLGHRAELESTDDADCGAARRSLLTRLVLQLGHRRGGQSGSPAAA